MKNVDEIYNETMKDLENYDVDAAFNKIVELANKGVSRKIEEFDIVFENIKKDSVGKDKQRKKTGVLKKVLALVLMVTMVTSMTGCSKEKTTGSDEIALSGYEQILADLSSEFHSEANSKGRKIGSELSQKMQNSYYEGNYEMMSDEDIVLGIARIIDGDDWYEYFDVNLSSLALADINNQKYSIAAAIYEGILEAVGDFAYLPDDFDKFVENIVGKGIVLEYCEHFGELVYNKVDRELTTDEIVNNVLLLARYYRAKAVEDKDTTLTLS